MSNKFQIEYESADGWRTRWCRLACDVELMRKEQRTQERQDRIERRASLANLRVGRAMREFDAEREQINQAPLNQIQPNLSEAIMTVLGTLPQGMTMRFFWADGKQHLGMTPAGEVEQVLYLNRLPNGVGIPTPVVLH